MYVDLWMKKEVISIRSDASLAEARELFASHRIRKLPVVSDGKLVGILSPRDIEKAMPSILDAESLKEAEFLSANTRVETVMTAAPITVAAGTSLLEAVETMQRNKISGLPVVEDDSLVGIVSITDMLDAFLDIMTTRGAGTRIDLKIDHRPESFFLLIKAFQRQDREILAIIQHYEFSKDHQLISIEIRGAADEALLEQLWKSGATIERVTETT